MANRSLIALALALLFAAGLTQSCFTVHQTERAILLQFGEIVRSDFTPGLHFKFPVVQSVQKFDARLLTMESQPKSFLTQEKKNVRVDYFVKWKIKDTLTYYRATRGQENNASDLLSAIINRVLSDAFGARTIQQAVSGGRDEFKSSVRTATGDKLADLGVELVDVRVKRIDLPDEVSESVYERMRAERTRTASDFRARGAEEAEKIRAEADRAATTIVATAYKEAETLRGEGDAKVAEIYARAYSQDAEFYSFYRTLNLYRDAWRGRQDLMVLEPKGELFQHFKGPGGPR